MYCYYQWYSGKQPHQIWEKYGTPPQVKVENAKTSVYVESPLYLNIFSESVCLRLTPKMDLSMTRLIDT